MAEVVLVEHVVLEVAEVQGVDVVVDEEEVDREAEAVDVEKAFPLFSTLSIITKF